MNWRRRRQQLTAESKYRLQHRLSASWKKRQLEYYHRPVKGLTSQSERRTDRHLQRAKVTREIRLSRLSIPTKVTTTATARVFMTTTATATARRFVAEEAILPSFRRPGFVDGQRAIIKRESIESANGTIRFFLRLHRNKAESARFAGEFILDDFDV